MSSRRKKIDSDYNQIISITKTTITKEINNEDEKNNHNNYNEEELNEVIKAFEFFDINHRGKVSISELIKCYLHLEI